MRLSLGLGLSDYRPRLGGGVSAPGTYSPATWGPLEIALTSGQESYPITMSALFPPETLTTDTVRLQVRSLPSLTEVLNVAITVGSGNQTFPGLSSITSGSYRLRQRLERGALYDDWSNEIDQGPDVIAPVLTLPTGMQTGSSTADLTVTTDTAEGTLYWAVLPAASAAPDNTAIQAGTGATAFGSQAVTATGVRTVNVTGLSSSTAYKAYLFQKDAATAPNSSTVAATATFTTVAGVTYSHGDVIVTGAGAGDTTASFTGLTFATGIATIMVRAVESAASTVTLNGSAMTMRRRETVEFVGAIEVWDAAVTAGSSNTIAITYPSFCPHRIISYGTMQGAVFSTANGSATLNEGDPHLLPSVTVPAGGIALAGFLENGGASITPATGATGTTIIDEVNVFANSETKGVSVGYRNSTGQVGFNFGFGSFPRVVAVYGPA